MRLRATTLAALAALALAGCEKTQPTTANEPHAPPGGGSASRPVPATSKSGLPMVYLPGGEFLMGSAAGNADEAPAHRVRLTGFLMDKYEVTQEMFARAQLPNPSHWQGNGRRPVERVRWRDAKQYCNERSLLEGLKPCYNEKTLDWDCDYSANGYRLPTEAEWEFACRAGDTAAPGPPSQLRQAAWFADNADQKTHPVGEKRPNPWGLCDMLGNVAEWCEDVYSPAYYQQSPVADPTGPPNTGKDVKRVIRGGSWKSSAGQCAPTVRQGERTGDSDACFATDFCGFRCVRRPSAEELRMILAAPRP